MLFNSFQFIFLFLPLAFVGYFATNKFVSVNVGKLCLILASFVFYGYWNIKYVPLLLVSIFVNYILGAAMSDGDRPFCRRLGRNVSRDGIAARGMHDAFWLSGGTGG